MSALIESENGLRFHTKGASEVLLGSCTKFLNEKGLTFLTSGHVF